MRKHYVDNIRWITVMLVVLYHVIYMYNGVATSGVIGPFHAVQYQDALQYVLYPWFMALLFIISGMSSRYFLENHTIKDFIRVRTRKLLVPSTIGLFVFHWILGYFNMAISNAFETIPASMPKLALYFIMVASGTGVLWYIQMLWLFSLGLALIRKWEKGRLYSVCGKASPLLLLLLGIPVWAAAQIFNTPMIPVYRFGIYGFCFLLGYFVFSHDQVVARLSRYRYLLLAAALLLGCGYVLFYFGENYAVKPVVNSPFSIVYGWTVILAVFAAMKSWGDHTSPLSSWMTKHSFGLYVFHYLPLAAAAYLMDRYFPLPAFPSYLIVTAAAFWGGYLLYEMISRIPVLRWCVLGIRKEKKHVL